MPELSNLLERVEAEYCASQERLKENKAQQRSHYREAERRLEYFGEVCGQLRDLWRPRLEALAEYFRERERATAAPELRRSLRAATLHLQTSAALLDLTFSATIDRDVQTLQVNYDLQVLPVLMQFVPHAHLEMPLAQVDLERVAGWIDDQIVNFAKTCFSLTEDQVYLNEYLVEDAVAGIKFPRFAAALTSEANGATQYFISEDTRREFQQRERR